MAIEKNVNQTIMKDFKLPDKIHSLYTYTHYHCFNVNINYKLSVGNVHNINNLNLIPP